MRAAMKAVNQEAAKLGTSAGPLNTKGLTDYQAGLLKIKQETLELAKQKNEAAAADRAASLALQQSLRDEANARREAIALAKQQAEAAKQQAEATRKASVNFPNSSALQTFPTPQRTNTVDPTKELIRLTTEDYKKGAITLKEYNAEIARLNAILAQNAQGQKNDSSATKENTDATNKATLSKKQLAQMLAEEKLKQQQANAELKNNAREMLNAKGSIEQRKAALERLVTAYARLSTAERESVAGNRMADIIKGLRSQIQGLEDQTKSSKSGVAGFFEYLKSSILSTLGPIALLTAAWTAAKALFAHNVEISDEFVDVQRTAKLSADEVDNLGERLKKINTRTTLEGLLDIGFIGGRLGVAKADIVDFVKEVDQLAVVLKKELPGGADAVATSLGKIITTYKLTQREGITLQDALRKVGSSLLEVSHNGGAPVAYLQEFALKTAAVSQQANISLPTILAYGAVLSKAGVQASVASTGVNRLISDLSLKRDKYFAIAQLADSTLTIEKFTNLINTDTTAALDLFFKGLKSGNPTQTESADRLATLALTAGRVKTTVITLAEAQQQLSEKTTIANKAYEEGTSVARNFDAANSSLAASYDKIKNAISNYFTSASNGRVLAELLNSFTDNRTQAERLADAYLKNKHNAEEADTALKPLIARYDELKATGKLTTDQQNDLRDVTAKIGSLLPGVVTLWSQYGNALDISRGKVDQLTSAQARLLEASNRGAIKGLNDEYDADTKRLERANKNKGKLTFGIALSELFFSQNKTAKTLRDDSDKEIADITLGLVAKIEKIRELGGKLSKAQQKLLDEIKPVKPVKQDLILTGTGEGTEADEQENLITITKINKQIKDLQEANKKLSIYSDEFKKNIAKIRDLRKQLKIAQNGGVDVDADKLAEKAAKKAESVAKELISKRNNLQKEIDAMVAASSRKQLSADDEEVQAVTDKYATLREKAKQHYDEVNKLIPKDKRASFNLTLSGLDTAEAGEKADVLYSQAAKKNLQALDIQKQQFIAYEEFRNDFGADMAAKRFGKEIVDNKSYLQKLQAEATKIELIPEDKRTGGQKDYLTELRKRIADEVNLQNAKYAELLKSLQGYQSKVDAATESYARERDEIAKNPLKVSGKELAEQYEKAAADFKDKMSKISLDEVFDGGKLESLFGNLDQVASSDIDKLIAVVALKSKELSAKFNPLDIENIQQKLEQAKAVLIARNPFAELGKSIKAVFSDGADGAKKSAKDIKVDWNNLAAATAGSFAFINDAVQSTDVLKDSIGEVGTTAISSLAATAAVAVGVTTAIKSAEKASVVLAVISAALVVVQAVSKVISSIFNAGDKRIENKIKGYQVQLAGLERGFTNLEKAVNESVGLDFYANSAKKIENLKQQQALLIQQRDAERGKKKSDSAKIDEYQAKIDEIPGKIKDVQQAITDMLVQTNFKDFSSKLSDAFADAFSNGEDSLANFNKAFNEVIANSVKKSLELKLIQPEVDKFIKDYSDYLQNNSLDPKNFDFDKYKAILKQKGDEFTAALDPFSDYFKEKKTSTTTARGEVGAAITEETASRSMGIWSGTQIGVLQVRDGVLQSKAELIQVRSLMTAASNTFGDMYKIGVDRLNQLIKIEQNTANTVQRLDDAVTELKKISKSSANIETNSKSTGSLRGSGLV